MAKLKGAVKNALIDHLPHAWIAIREIKRPRSAEVELNYLRHLVGDGRVGVDVGANMGLYSRPLAQLCRTVHAIEPEPRMALFLRQTLPHRAIIHECAASDASGEATLHVPRSGGVTVFGTAALDPRGIEADELVPVSVRIERIDDLVAGPADFVKIDVEGHELSALQGAIGLFDRSSPVFLVESEERHRSGITGEVFNFFAARGYSGHFIHGSLLRPVEAFTSDLQDTSALTRDGGRKPGRFYINNFLFFPPGRASQFCADTGLHRE